MSIHAMSTVWQRSTASGSTLLLLLALADHANDSGQCYPAIETLAAKTRMSERQTIRIIQAAEQLGELTTQRSANKANHYTLTPAGQPIQPTSPQAANQPTSGKPLPRGDKMSPQTRAGVTSCHPQGDISDRKCHPNHQFDDDEKNNKNKAHPSKNFGDDQSPEFKAAANEIATFLGSDWKIKHTGVITELANGCAEVGFTPNLIRALWQNDIVAECARGTVRNPPGLFIARMREAITRYRNIQTEEVTA